MKKQKRETRRWPSWPRPSLGQLGQRMTNDQRPTANESSVTQKWVRSGFTLVEILLYVAISSSILLVATIFLNTLLSSRIKNQSLSEVNAQGVSALQIVTQTVRNAEAIFLPIVGGSGGTLILDVVPISNDPTVFAVSNGVLQVTEAGGTPISLTNSRVTATTFSVRNLSRTGTPGVVEVTLTLSYVNPNNRNEYSVTKTFITSASLRHP